MNRIKTFFGNLFTGLAGWQTYAAIAALVAALMGSVLFWFNAKIDAAYTAGQKSDRVEQLETTVTDLKALSKANKESTDAIQKNLDLVGGMAADVDRLDRLRKQDAATFNGRVQRATEPAIRAYAGQAEQDIGTVESSRDGFASEALRASTAAWGYEDTLQARREALAAKRESISAKRKTLKPTE